MMQAGSLSHCSGRWGGRGAMMRQPMVMLLLSLVGWSGRPALALESDAGAAAAGPQQHAAIGIVAEKSAGVEVAIGSVEKSAQNPLFNQDRPWEGSTTQDASINNGCEHHPIFVVAGSSFPGCASAGGGGGCRNRALLSQRTQTTSPRPSTGTRTSSTRPAIRWASGGCGTGSAPTAAATSSSATPTAATAFVGTSQHSASTRPGVTSSAPTCTAATTTSSCRAEAWASSATSTRQTHPSVSRPSAAAPGDRDPAACRRASGPAATRTASAARAPPPTD